MDTKISGPIQKKTSISDESTSDMMEFDETALVTDQQLEAKMRRLQEEEQLLLEQHAALEAGNNADDFAALDHQDQLRLNHLKQEEIHRKQARRLARCRQQAQEQGQSQAQALDLAPVQRREQGSRRRVCTVRVNNLHAAEAIETDV